MRSELKVLLRAEQEVTVTLVPREVEARRKQGPLLERSQVDSHASMRAMERASRTLGELPRTTKQATEKMIGGRLDELCWGTTRLLRGKFEVNWLELAWLGKTQTSDEHLCGDDNGVRKVQTTRRQQETARWRREDVDQLVGDPFNPKPDSSMAVGGAEPPLGPPDGTRNDD